jgi:flagellar basal body rod protein FlgG
VPQNGTVAVDMSPGTLRHTGNPLDIAIEGDGYFEIMTNAGPAYTRRGTLHLDTGGRLVTEQGYPLMGVGGELVVSGTSVAIDPNGEVRQPDRTIGQVKLMRFANPDNLVSLGNGLFLQGSARPADTGTDGTIRAGFQESSNVNSPREMVQLAETVRHFEAMQKIMQGYDDAFEKTLHKLGDF